MFDSREGLNCDINIQNMVGVGGGVKVFLLESSGGIFISNQRRTKKMASGDLDQISLSTENR